MMKEMMIKAMVAVQTQLHYFAKKEKGAVDIVAIVILIAVAIGLAIIFRRQLVTLLGNWFGQIGDAGDQAVANGASGNEGHISLLF